MKKFMAVYIGTAGALERSNWEKMDPAKRQALEAEGMKAWGDWMAKHAAIVVEQGGPLGKTKRVSTQGIADTKNDLAGYVVVQAESQDAAAKLFENHPHFSIFPGDSVEIMECLPIPGMG
jgi:hypothetical protein